MTTMPDLDRPPPPTLRPARLSRLAEQHETGQNTGCVLLDTDSVTPVAGLSVRVQYDSVQFLATANAGGQFDEMRLVLVSWLNRNRP